MAPRRGGRRAGPRRCRRRQTRSGPRRPAACAAARRQSGSGLAWATSSLVTSGVSGRQAEHPQGAPGRDPVAALVGDGPGNLAVRSAWPADSGCSGQRPDRASLGQVLLGMRRSAAWPMSSLDQRPAGLPEQRGHEQAAAHPDPPVDPPHRQVDATAGPAPCARRSRAGTRCRSASRRGRTGRRAGAARGVARRRATAPVWQAARITRRVPPPPRSWCRSGRAARTDGEGEVGRAPSPALIWCRTLAGARVKLVQHAAVQSGPRPRHRRAPTSLPLPGRDRASARGSCCRGVHGRHPPEMHGT